AGICLPVPLLAATGLSVPLPNVVERLAAALVPWAEPVTAEPVAFRGEIVPTAAEATPAATVPQATRPAALPASAVRTTPAAKRTRPAVLALAPAGAEPAAPR